MSRRKELPKYVVKRIKLIKGKIEPEPIQTLKPRTYTMDDFPGFKKIWNEIIKQKKKIKPATEQLL